MAYLFRPGPFKWVMLWIIMSNALPVHAVLWTASTWIEPRLQWGRLGQISAGAYRDRERAAYWDGKNESGEQIASGVYFYQIRTGNYREMRKMVILK